MHWITEIRTVIRGVSHILNVTSAVIVFKASDCAECVCVMQACYAMVNYKHHPKALCKAPEMVSGVIESLAMLTKGPFTAYWALWSLNSLNQLLKRFLLGAWECLFFCSSALFHHFNDDEAATWCFHLFLSHIRTIACCTVNFFASISSFTLFIHFFGCLPWFLFPLI